MDEEISIQNERDIAGPTGVGMAFAVGFFFSFRWILSLFATTVLGAETHVSGGLSLALNFLLLGFICIHSLGAGSRTFSSMLRLSSVRWVVAFLLFSLISLVWSSTASLAASLVYWCEMAADAAMVILLLRAAPAIDIASSLCRIGPMMCAVELDTDHPFLPTYVDSGQDRSPIVVDLDLGMRTRQPACDQHQSSLCLVRRFGAPVDHL